MPNTCEEISSNSEEEEEEGKRVPPRAEANEATDANEAAGSNVVSDKLRVEMKRRFSTETNNVMKGVQALSPKHTGFLDKQLLLPMAQHYGVREENLSAELHQARRQHPLSTPYDKCLAPPLVLPLLVLPLLVLPLLVLPLLVLPLLVLPLLVLPLLVLPLLVLPLLVLPLLVLPLLVRCTIDPMSAVWRSVGISAETTFPLGQSRWDWDEPEEGTETNPRRGGGEVTTETAISHHH
uniref:Uncharacterized protein n=1 Tax=Knipowitschia caucasica TaxID=637954 RepID=A0AAV2KNT1_KNICA